MKNVFMYPYNTGSESCKELAKALGIRRIKHDNSSFKGGANKLVINWGATKIPQEVENCIVLNSPDCVHNACNKQRTYDILSDEDLCPEYTALKVLAELWLTNGKCHTIVERHTLTGMGGEGIRIVENPEELSDDAKVYCKYVPKKSEYRVHVIGGVPVDVQRKARRRDVPDDKVNWKVRNHANGFIYARGIELGEVPPDVIQSSVLAVELLGLNFGAVDCIYNEKEGRAYVLEVNTAPGLSGETVDIYRQAMEELILGIME